MAKKVTDESRLSVPLKFRLTAADAAALQEKVALSGLTMSEFLRQAIVQNKTKIVVHKPTADAARILYLLNKESNNVNQIARQLHAARLSGKVSEQTYKHALAQLAEINERAAEIRKALGV